MTKIKYSIPLFCSIDLNISFLKLIKTNPEYFYNNIEINSVYGAPNFCIWSGGIAPQNLKQFSKEELEKIFYTLNNEFNIPINLTFTNSLLKNCHYKDRFGHLCLELASNNLNEITVFNEDFMLYLKNKYCNFKYNLSINKLEQIKNKYNKYILNSSDLSLLKDLKNEEKSKLELLINLFCQKDCFNKEEHLFLNNSSILNYGKKYLFKNCNKNSIDKITYEDINNNYLPAGFNQFKIDENINNPIELLLIYCDYMVKPEYKNSVINIIIKNLKN